MPATVIFAQGDLSRTWRASASVQLAIALFLQASTFGVGAGRGVSVCAVNETPIKETEINPATATVSRLGRVLFENVLWFFIS
jgi:hypothetical protein